MTRPGRCRPDGGRSPEPRGRGVLLARRQAGAAPAHVPTTTTRAIRPTSTRRPRGSRTRRRSRRRHVQGGALRRAGDPRRRADEEVYTVYQRIADAGWALSQHTIRHEEIERYIKIMERVAAKTPCADPRFPGRARVRDQRPIERLKAIGVACARSIMMSATTTRAGRPARRSRCSRAASRWARARTPTSSAR